MSLLLSIFSDVTPTRRAHSALLQHFMAPLGSIIELFHIYGTAIFYLKRPLHFLLRKHPGVLSREPAVSGTDGLDVHTQAASLQLPGTQMPPFPLLMLL